MSGNVKIRKQWQLQGEGARGSLHRLRSQLAEDGCPESQVIMARQLLEDADKDNDPSHSQKCEFQAVGWLLKAAKLADVEAFNLLKDCFAIGKGINNKNYGEVKHFLELDNNERDFSVTARKVFRSLTTLQDDYVTTNQLMLMLLPTDQNPPNNTIQYDGDHLSEEELVTAATKLCKGEMPNIKLPTPESLSCKMQKSFLGDVEKFPVRLKRHLRQSHVIFLDVLCNMTGKALGYLFSWPMFHTILLLSLCNSITLNLLVFAFPLFIFYVGILTMIFCSLGLVANSYQLSAFDLWLQVFSHANDKLDLAITRRKFLSKNFGIYYKMASGFIMSILIFPHCEATFVWNSCVGSLSAVMCFFVWFTLHTSINIPLLAHTALCILPACSKHLRILGISLPSQFTFSALEWLLFANMLIVFSLILVKTRGVYEFLLPNIAAIMWIYLGLGVFDDMLSWNAANSFLVWTVIILCPLAFALFATLYVMYLSLHLEHFVLISTSSVLILCQFILAKKLLVKRTKVKTFVFALQLLCIMMVVFKNIPTAWLEISSPILNHNETSNLDWETYQQLCKEPVELHGTNIGTKLACSQLTGTEISWEGQVLDVVVTNIQNRLEESIQSLPSIVAELLRCLLGSSYRKSCLELHGFEYERCSTIASLSSRDCHLRSWDSMIFHVTIQMTKGYWNSAEVTLEVSNKFQDFVANLQSGDVVQFNGSLIVDLIKLKPHINLSAIKCKHCVQNLVSVNTSETITIHAQFLTLKSLKFLGQVLRIF